jgi:hypothetical protein
MLQPSNWHLLTAESQSLYTSVSTEEWKLLMRDPGLRARIEALLIHLRDSIDVTSLLFVCVEANHRRTVAELIRAGDGAMQWQWEQRATR